MDGGSHACPPTPHKSLVGSAVQHWRDVKDSGERKGERGEKSVAQLTDRAIATTPAGFAVDSVVEALVWRRATRRLLNGHSRFTHDLEDRPGGWTPQGEAQALSGTTAPDGRRAAAEKKIGFGPVHGILAHQRSLLYSFPFPFFLFLCSKFKDSNYV
jgi:hypothetical protein